MPYTCSVYGCSNRSGRDNVSFYRFPTISKRYSAQLQNIIKVRRDIWVEVIRRADLSDDKIKNSRVCSVHFVTGKPATITDFNHSDWAPSLNLGHNGNSTKLKEAVEMLQHTAFNLSAMESSSVDDDTMNVSSVECQTDPVLLTSIECQTD